MARLPRLSLAGYAHHVIQRGNNRQAIFLTDDDRRFMLALLHEAAQTHQVALHAYVLMSNHIHLLLTPQTDEGVPKMMQSVGRRYVRYFNDRTRRSGTLWEGRYKSTLIQTDAYLLTCMASIDLNPVRAGMVAQPADYAWSSHGAYIGLRHDRLITPHPLYWSLGNTPFSREAAYAALVGAGVSAGQHEQLTDATLGAWALGDAAFTAALQKQTPRRISKAKAGRPAAGKLTAQD